MCRRVIRYARSITQLIETIIEENEQKKNNKERKEEKNNLFCVQLYTVQFELKRCEFLK